MSKRVPLVDTAAGPIPRLGLGTWELRGETCTGIVRAALEMGYPMIDTAQGYANEAEVGRGLAQSGVPRSNVFLVTKVHPDRATAADLGASLDESLDKLGTDYVDLLLIHWPNPQIDLEESIKALAAVQTDGRARAVGLSNFVSAKLAEAHRIAAKAGVLLAAEQIEYHPYLDQSVMLNALRSRSMAVMAYCPIALGRVVNDPVIADIAKVHGRSPVQVALRWLLQQPQVVAIPRTSKPDRLGENLDVFDFELSPGEMQRVSALAKAGIRLVNEPKWVPEWD